MAGDTCACPEERAVKPSQAQSAELSWFVWYFLINRAEYKLHL